MKKIVLITTLSLLFTITAWGATLDCNEALVEQGVCADVDNALLYYQGSRETMAEISAAISTTQKYVPEFECSEAAVAAEMCEESEIGSTVNNPISSEQFADNFIKAIIERLVIIYRGNVAGDAARAEAAASVDQEVEIE